MTKKKSCNNCKMLETDDGCTMAETNHISDPFEIAARVKHGENIFDVMPDYCAEYEMQ